MSDAVKDPSAATNGSPARRRSSGAATLRRLAAATARLEERRDRLDGLEERARSLALSDVIVVDGELAVIEALDAQLASARAALISLDSDHSESGALEATRGTGRCGHMGRARRARGPRPTPGTDARGRTCRGAPNAAALDRRRRNDRPRRR